MVGIPLRARSGGDFGAEHLTTEVPMRGSENTGSRGSLRGEPERRRALRSFRRAARLLSAARAERERNARVLAELGALAAARSEAVA